MIRIKTVVTFTHVRTGDSEDFYMLASTPEEAIAVAKELTLFSASDLTVCTISVRRAK